MNTPYDAIMAQLVEIYAAGRADATCGRYAASTPEMTALLDTIHAEWMEQLCRTSAGLLPFDDTHERAVTPDWLRRMQSNHHV